MRIVFIHPASVGPVSSGRFGGNETIISYVTSVTKTKEIQLLYTVGHYEELLIRIW